MNRCTVTHEDRKAKLLCYYADNGSIRLVESRSNRTPWLNALAFPFVIYETVRWSGLRGLES